MQASKRLDLSVDFNTQERAKALIGYIVHAEMTVIAAVVKANMSCQNSRIYYARYLADPNRTISSTSKKRTRCTQDQVSNLIRYIRVDKMTIMETSIKANMSYQSSCTYHRKYIHNPNNAIPKPRARGSLGIMCTQSQIDRLIGYIDDDKMTLSATTRKAKICFRTDDHNHAIPTPGIYGTRQGFMHNQDRSLLTTPHLDNRLPFTQDQIEKLIGYIEHDKMAISVASIKANISTSSGGNYYRKQMLYRSK
ncbi:hypothetical protein K501DRAFT_273556 [Backusella circina FSU 941]|nr:hypothetical protein K501DRAFT_273556 [Backusella circina FSU 941]